MRKERKTDGGKEERESRPRVPPFRRDVVQPTLFSALRLRQLTLIMYSILLCECFSITDSIQISGFTWNQKHRTCERL